MNLIKQIVRPGEYGTQTIKMIVRSNERGAQGEQGEKGEAATITAGQAYAVEEGQQAVINTGTSSNAVFDFYLPKGPKGDDGAIQYTAGTGINITSENVIEATGDATAAWGGIQGNIASQTDLQNEFGLYTKTADLPNLSTAYVGTNNLVDGAVATAKIADGAVTTAKINDGSVTASKIEDGTIPKSKFAPYALNNGIITPDNLSPSADTPTGWYNMLTAVGATYQGFYVTRYSILSKFDYQPSQYGNLVTINNATDMVQLWFRYNNPILTRTGNSNGWQHPGGGNWATIYDTASISDFTSQITFSGCSPVPESSSFGFKAIKNGRMVFLSGRINVTSSISSYTNLASLPASIRPIADVSVNAGSKVIDVRYSGAVQCHSDLSDGDSVTFTATYLSQS